MASALALVFALVPGAAVTALVLAVRRDAEHLAEVLLVKAAHRAGLAVNVWTFRNDALPRIVAHLRSQDLECVTMADLFAV